jgi:DNA-binding LacI/PurR family transcriptional regulator
MTRKPETHRARTIDACIAIARLDDATYTSVTVSRIFSDIDYQRERVADALSKLDTLAPDTRAKIVEALTVLGYIPRESAPL